MNRRMTIRILVLSVALALLWPAASALCIATAKPNPIETENFYFEPRPESPDTFWIVEESTNKPIGYAKWDPVLRRYTLFNFKNQYRGFYQATLGQRRHLSYQPYYDTNFTNTFEGAHYYQQYLGYDKNNRYIGVFILSLGGRPESPDVPFGELGGKMVLYKIGNIPVRYPESIQPFTPDYDILEDLLDRDVTNPTPKYTK
jgi:hypothetical protein